ncbi:hypothetical protein [Pelagibacterium halotolerans]|uniref:Hint domain-containing protein n=1 Tax=Pelagibacterium halotolerans TaxID=531813 RepID=UPI00385129C5
MAAGIAPHAGFDGQHCFTADTPIALWDGTRKPIADIRAGDMVVSYGADGGLVPGRVARTFRGETHDWVELSYAAADGAEQTLTATPGHPFLTADGTFAPIAELIDANGHAEIVLVDGRTVSAKARLVRWTRETAGQYEAAAAVCTQGHLALKPRPQDAWATYNFEVEGTHTYVAGGVRVHNRCLENVVTETTLNALVDAGIIDPDTDTIIQTESGQYLLFTQEGRHVTEGALEGQLLTQVIEVFSDYAQHVGDAIGSVGVTQYPAGFGIHDVFELSYDMFNSCETSRVDLSGSREKAGRLPQFLSAMRTIVARRPVAELT